uniref:Uncharacterized protein n=1 Tax=Knipowitschia caucasica TaxID=637954 RepID=A0AAV2M3I0_KNICA
MVPHMVPLKRPRHEVLVPENLSLLGVEAPENLSQRNDEDSSAESLDSVSHACSPEIPLKYLSSSDVGSQCNKSPSPRPHNDSSSNQASWSRHLMQQTLMDEGLRLARMVSHERAAKLSLGPDANHTTAEGDFCNITDVTIFSLWMCLTPASR